MDRRRRMIGHIALTALVVGVGLSWTSLSTVGTVTHNSEQISSENRAEIQPSTNAAGEPPAATAASAVNVAPRSRLAAGVPLWTRVTRETGLWSGSEGGVEFNRVPAGTTVRVLQQSGARFRIFYSGDEELKKPGEAWISATDATGADWPSFVRARSVTSLRTDPSENGTVVTQVPGRTYFEVLETSGRDWAHVFLAANPATGTPLEAWVDGEDVVSSPRDPREFRDYTLSHAIAMASPPDVWLKVPYRSQLDGTSYETANCGPTVLWMALQAFTSAPSVSALREQTLRLQDIDDCDDCGVFIEHLAAVGRDRGVKTLGLYDQEPDTFHHWTPDEIRAQLRAGRVVIPQVMYRLLSGRDRSDYWGDHFVAVVGYVDDRFIYHDPVDTLGPGSDRTITSERLMKAMANSDFPYAAFSVGS